MVRGFQPRLAVLAALILLAGSLLTLSPARAASLSGSVDHAFMGARETFNYVLSLTGGDGREPPDLSPLNADFDIVDRGRRSRMDVLSGRRVMVNEWVMTLAPKRTGILTVPGLSVNGMTSAPLKIEVVPALPAKPLDDDAALFVRVDAGNVSPYAQSLIPVVVRIYDGVGLRQGRMAPPTADGASLTANGEQRVYVRNVGKKRYGVIEQSFLMQPQKSGTVTIEPVVVEAAVPRRTNTAASALPNLLGRGGISPLDFEDVTIRSEPLAVEVKPRPADVEGWFLPAHEVRLTQEWSSAPGTATVGVALTRTLRLRARGASPNQLPPLPVAEVEGARQYEDAVKSERMLVEGMEGAELTKAISVVPTRAGEITLPAISVDWWNMDKARPERAELPAVTLHVAPAADAPQAAPPAAATAADAAPATDAPEAPARAPSLSGILAGMEGLLAPAGGALALAALLAAGLFWRRRRAARPRAAAAPSAPVPRPRIGPKAEAGHAPARMVSFPTAEAAERALVRACRASDAQSAHTAFLSWLRLSAGAGGGSFHTPKMALAVRHLSQALYGAEAAPWRGREFLSAFNGEKRARRTRGRAAGRQRIAPLYPTG